MIRKKSGKSIWPNLRQLAASMVVFGFISFPISANGHTYYVAKSGGDFTTIQAAVDVAGAGDTVFVRTGTYVEVVNINNSGTNSAQLVVMAYPGEQPVIDGEAGVESVNSGLPAGDLARVDPVSGRGFNWNTLVNIAGDYVVFQGFEIKRSMGRGLRLYEFGGDGRPQHVDILSCNIHDIRNVGILVYHSDNVLIEDCDIWHCSCYATYARSAHTLDWAGGYIPTSSNHITLRGNRIFENYGEGILTGYMNCVDQVIEGNVVYDNYAVQIYCHRVDSLAVRGNLFYHTGNPDFFRDGGPSGGIVVSNETQFDTPPGKNITITNNIVIGCGVNFEVWSGSYNVENLLVAHNIFINASVSNAVGFRAMSYSNVRFENNLILQDENTVAGFSVRPGITFSHNLWSRNPIEAVSSPNDIIGDPVLYNAYATLLAGNVDPAWYKLQDTSPAISAAKTLSEVVMDYWGAARDNNPDMGAHEYDNSTHIGNFNDGMPDDTKEPQLSIYPNPSNGKTIIRLNHNSPSIYTGNILMIYSITGSLEDELNIENNEFIWNNNSVPNGIYFMKLNGARNDPGQRLLLIR